MRRVVVTSFVLASAPVVAPAAPGPPDPDEAAPARITGTVVDGEGRPVVGAVVSNFWLYPAPPAPPVPHDDPRAGALQATAGDDGRFELVIPDGRELGGLFAMDPERRRGGVAPVDGASLEITVEPLAMLRGRCWSTALSLVPREIGGALIRAPVGQIVDWRVDPETGAFELPVPPGDYRLYVMSIEARTLTKDLTVEAGRPALDLGVLDLEPSIIARHYGKAPPAAWNVSAARGVDRNVTLADYRGRWVLLEFWGFW
ncbi:MAG: hypothetical protein ACYTJ0_10680 [Planctomycetota bacterium]|jgi:hypothetical protein